MWRVIQIFLSLFDGGIKNVVATLGTAFTSSHAKLLKRYTKDVVLLFDGDEAGKKASQRALPILLEEGLRVKFILFPEKLDPDLFLKQKGQKEFLKLLSNSQDLFFSLLQERLTEIKNRGGDKFELLDQMAPMLSKVENEDLFSLYKQRLLDLFGSDQKLALKALNKRLNLKKEPKTKDLSSPKATESEKISLKEALHSERLILTLCLDSEEILSEFSGEKRPKLA